MKRPYPLLLLLLVLGVIVLGGVAVRDGMARQDSSLRAGARLDLAIEGAIGRLLTLLEDRHDMAASGDAPAAARQAARMGEEIARIDLLLAVHPAPARVAELAAALGRLRALDANAGSRPLEEGKRDLFAAAQSHLALSANAGRPDRGFVLLLLFLGLYGALLGAVAGALMAEGQFALAPEPNSGSDPEPAPAPEAVPDTAPDPGFAARAAIEVERALHHGRPLAVLALCIDWYEELLDGRGPEAAAAARQAVEAALAGALEKAALVGPGTGPGSWLVLAPELSPRGADALAGRLVLDLGGAELAAAGRHFGLTISAGVSALERDATDIAPALARARTALSEAEESGGDCHVCIWPPSPAPADPKLRPV